MCNYLFEILINTVYAVNNSVIRIKREQELRTRGDGNLSFSLKNRTKNKNIALKCLKKQELYQSNLKYLSLVNHSNKVNQYLGDEVDFLSLFSTVFCE